MSGGEEQIECPLCMEPLEMDDISFFPCTCGYQICRFCWHRIRTYENGLCPACRKLYPENPAEFKPLSDDELQNIKKERRQKDVQRKQKAAENRKHLANVRVVQKNLVFVVGLSPRLADPEVLKRHEYFGKFGKIHKVVINQSTTYAGSQSNGPSAGAYVTYIRAEDALRALQNVNNVFVDGRTLKASLGTTKYCSHFLKGTQCPKQDCMYLHELGEEAASFTKDEMQQGKHQEYEQKLYELFMNSQNTTNPVTKTTNSSTVPNQTNRKKNASPPAVVPQAPQHHNPTSYNSGTAALHQITNKTDTRLTNGNGNKPHSPPSPTSSDGDMTPTPTDNPEKAPGANLNRHNNRPPAPPSQYTIQPDKNANSTITDQQLSNSLPKSELLPLSSQSPPTQVPSTHSPPLVGQIPPNIGASTKKAIFDANPENSLSLFSGSGFPLMRSAKPVQPPVPPQVPPRDPITSTEIPDHIPVSSSTDWQAAFGFKSSNSEHHDDDLGFDPWDESAKGLADLIEREQGGHQNHINHYPHMGFQPHSIPPGFTPSHINPYLQKSELELLGHSKILGLVSSPSRPPGFAHKQQQHQPNPYTNVISDSSGIDPPHNEDIFTKNWQEGLKALFPNVNISFGAPQFASTSANRPISQQQHHQHHQHPQHAKSWPSQSQCNNTYSTGDWMAQDPAIVTSGSISDAQSLSSVEDQPPHWMKSLQQLTEIDTNPNHRLPFVQNFPFNGRRWSQNPPPGFQSQIRPNTQITEPHTLAEGLQ